MKIIKGRGGEDRVVTLLISAVFILCPLWPLAHLYLHSGVINIETFAYSFFLSDFYWPSTSWMYYIIHFIA